MQAKMEILAMVLGFIGLFGTITITALPAWKVSAFIGANLIVMEELWEGLWMNCYRHADFRIQCKVYDSLLILPAELQAARGLMCLSVALVVISLIVTACGIQKTNCCGDSIKNKNITLAFGGSLYLLSFLTTLFLVSWVAHTVISNFSNPVLSDTEKRELGQAIYIGWATSGILLVTGVVILFRFSRRRPREEQPYRAAYLMEERDVQKQDLVYQEKTPSSFYKNQEYV